MLSRRAPGRLPLIASAACTSTASTVRTSTSLWWASIACTTSGFSPYLRARSAPTIACEPSTSWVSALPMSCRNAARLHWATSSWSSAAISPAMWALSTRCLSTFCPYEVR